MYLKEGSQIVDMLNVMGAHVSLMELENVRILKEMRNSVNRKVNCETANIHKTVSAAVRQIEDIRYIQQKIGFEQLSEDLQRLQGCVWSSRRQRSRAGDDAFNPGRKVRRKSQTEKIKRYCGNAKR